MTSQCFPTMAEVVKEVRRMTHYYPKLGLMGLSKGETQMDKVRKQLRYYGIMMAKEKDKEIVSGLLLSTKNDMAFEELFRTLPVKFTFNGETIYEGRTWRNEV